MLLCAYYYWVFLMFYYMYWCHCRATLCILLFCIVPVFYYQYNVTVVVVGLHCVLLLCIVLVFYYVIVVIVGMHCDTRSVPGRGDGRRWPPDAWGSDTGGNPTKLPSQAISCTAVLLRSIHLLGAGYRDWFLTVQYKSWKLGYCRKLRGMCTSFIRVFLCRLMVRIYFRPLILLVDIDFPSLFSYIVLFLYRWMVRIWPKLLITKPSRYWAIISPCVALPSTEKRQRKIDQSKKRVRLKVYYWY